MTITIYRRIIVGVSITYFKTINIRTRWVITIATFRSKPTAIIINSSGIIIVTGVGIGAPFCPFVA
jgi:hypothetical protein